MLLTLKAAIEAGARAELPAASVAVPATRVKDTVPVLALQPVIEIVRLVPLVETVLVQPAVSPVRLTFPSFSVMFESGKPLPKSA